MMFSLCSGISVTASADEQDESTSPAETSAPAEGPVAEGSSAELTAEGPAALFDCFFHIRRNIFRIGSVLCAEWTFRRRRADRTGISVALRGHARKDEFI
jgi:hypothetical protein